MLRRWIAAAAPTTLRQVASFALGNPGENHQGLLVLNFRTFERQSLFAQQLDKGRSISHADICGMLCKLEFMMRALVY